MTLTTNQEPKTAAVTSLDKLIADGILIGKYGLTPKSDDRHFLMDDDYRDQLRTLGMLDEKDEGMADDWVTISYKSQGWAKYGRAMYSPTLNRLRAQSFDEFYDGGIVD